jgi:hypothetical protein
VDAAADVEAGCVMLATGQAQPEGIVVDTMNAYWVNVGQNYAGPTNIVPNS